MAHIWLRSHVPQGSSSCLVLIMEIDVELSLLALVLSGSLINVLPKRNFVVVLTYDRYGRANVVATIDWDQRYRVQSC